MSRYYDETRKELAKVRVPVSDLTIGMHVIELDRPWTDTTFLFQGFVIANNNELQDLRAQCEYVFVEVTKETRALQAEQTAAHKSNARSGDLKRPPLAERLKWVKQVSFEQEATKARGSFEDARDFAKNALQSLRLGMDLDISKAKMAVSACVESILRNEQAMLFLLQIKNQDEYTAQHSMNVGAMSAAFGKHLGHTELEIEQLGLSGMLHDVGKIRVPEEILNKPGQLTKEEFAQIAQHTTYGRDILMSKRDLFRGAVDVAYGHHERLNGRGYPRSLKAHQIPYMAQVVGLVDTYDALTSARCYKPGMSPYRAMEILNDMKESHLSAELVDEFTRWMGLYPPGSLVELTTGEVAIVLSVESERVKLRPRVLVVLDKDKQPNAGEYKLDLATRPTAPDGNPYLVKQGLACGSFGINLRDYVDRGVLASPDAG